MCFIHGSVPIDSATENQRFSVEEYVFLVEGCTVHVYNTWPRFKCCVRYESWGIPGAHVSEVSYSVRYCHVSGMMIRIMLVQY